MEKRNFVIIEKSIDKKDGSGKFKKLVAVYSKLGETKKAYFDVNFKKETRQRFDAEMYSNKLVFPINILVDKYNEEEIANGVGGKQYFIKETTKNGFTNKLICFLDYEKITQAEKPKAKDEDDYL